MTAPKSWSERYTPEEITFLMIEERKYMEEEGRCDWCGHLVSIHSDSYDICFVPNCNCGIFSTATVVKELRERMGRHEGD